MELVEGSPVRPVENARKLLDLAVQIADGLAAADSAGNVHRDWKPDSILVTGAAIIGRQCLATLYHDRPSSLPELSAYPNARKTISPGRLS